MTDQPDGRSHAGAPEADASGAPAWDGVLFDLDDTLLDLRTAQRAAFTATVRRQWPGAQTADPAVLEAGVADFSPDVHGHYERYVAGELTFAEQRLARVADALAAMGVPEAYLEPVERLWVEDYEAAMRAGWAAFPRTAEVLEGIRDSGRGIGVVTNNVEEYQRGKLAAIGLGWIDVVVGSDTAGAPKPAAAPFLAGCAALGSAPSRTLCVGDSLRHDVAGARAAGLVPVWLHRAGVVDHGSAGEVGVERSTGAEEAAGAGRPADAAGPVDPAGPACPADPPRWDREQGCWRIPGLEALRAWL